MSQISQNLSRAEKLLNRWVGEKQLSADGKAFLKQNLDPFMDIKVKNLVGWPDVETGYSVVRCINQQITLSPPPSVTPGSNWDCAVVLHPWLNNHVMTLSTVRANNIITNITPAVTFPVGGIQAFGDTSPMTFTLDSTPSLGQILLPSSVAQGVGRVVGIGYEVHNTTAELYKQGSVTTSLLTNENRTSSMFYIQDPATAAFITGVPLRSYPSTLADVTIVPGSVTWEAKDGVYCVGHFHSNENSPFNVDYVNPILPVTDDTYGTNVSNVYYPNPIPAGGSDRASQACHLHPYHSTITWFSGLSYTTTLQLSAKIYYETFPYLSEPDVITLAKPSSEYDPLALEIMSHALASMPVAVKVDENFQGQWWADVVDSIASVLNFIPHPLAQTAATVGRLVSPTLRGINISDSVGVPANAAVKALPQPPARKKAKPLPPIPKKK